jgi:hypothetical protein
MVQSKEAKKQLDPKRGEVLKGKMFVFILYSFYIPALVLLLRAN